MKKLFFVLLCFGLISFSSFKSNVAFNHSTPTEQIHSVLVKSQEDSLNSNTFFFSIQPYFSAGRFSFTVPAGITKLSFEAVGGGGGAGGTFNGVTYDYGGGGGGAGAFAKGYLNVNSGDVINITVGAGGANGSSSKATPTAGTNGLPTTISIGSSVVLTTLGGNGGNPGTNTRGGFGGMATRPTVSDLARCILTSYSADLIPGGTGLFCKPGTFIVTGIPGTVYTTGEYNSLFPFTVPVFGGGNTMTLFPKYGIGGGNNVAPSTGYVVLTY